VIRHAQGIRTLMTTAALTAAVVLGGCETEGLNNVKANKAISPELLAAMEGKNVDPQSPMLVRLFKQEAELEVWKQNREGRFELVKTYPICRWSGELGPKVKEGDRQAPEGFYTITKGQMNPNSAYYLSFNMGYPNAFDQANGRTGSQLMVHGDCSSRGCYAMTDEQIGEIFALGREAFFGGQRSFQVQAYPFRMTAANFAKHRNNPHIPFWKMLKEGNDHFEVSRLEPKVDVCDRHYVFDAQSPEGSTTPLKFDSRRQCPVYTIDPDLATAVADKKQRDEVQIAQLTRANVPVAPVRTGMDGGMNPIFLAKLRPQEVRDANGDVRAVFGATGHVPAMGPNVVPPGERAVAMAAETPTGTVGAGTPTPRPAPQAKVAGPAPSSGNVFTRLFSSDAPTNQPSPSSTSSLINPIGGLRRALGIESAETKPTPPPTVAARTAQRPAQAAAIRPRPPAPQDASQPAPQQTASAVQAPPSATLMNGATPVMPASSFESRWSAAISR
jgi:murein L,D-transpeptidase YafK